MSDFLTVDLFVEDRAHEELLKHLVARVATEVGVPTRLRIRSARGGHGRAIQEYRNYQSVVTRNASSDPLPDLIVVGIDGNCMTAPGKRKEIGEATEPSFRGRLVAACPDPHVERWYLADLHSFHVVVGHRPTLGRKKCERDHYKRLLSEAVRRAGHPPTLGGIEFAEEIALSLDLYRASKNDSSFGSFVDDLRSGLRTFGSNSGGQ
jgi:hypothetical protein